MSLSWADHGTSFSIILYLVIAINKLNRGLGPLVAQDFAREGSNIAINYVSSKDAAEGLAAGIRSQSNVKAITIQGVRTLFCVF